VAQLGKQTGRVGCSLAKLRMEAFRVGFAEVRPQRLNPRPVGRGAAGLPAAANQHPHAAGAASCSELLREAALADAGLAGEQEQAPATGERVVDTADELGELPLAADEPAARCTGRRLGHGEVESRILPQDRLVQLTQATSGLDAQLLDQHGACSPEGLQRLGLAAGAVQAQHQLATQALPQRMLPHQPFQLAGELGVTTGGELGVETLLQRRQTRLLQAGDLGLRERLVGQVGKRCSTPHRERLGQQPRRGQRLGFTGLGDEPLEAREVELGRIDPQDIARGARHQPVVAELLAQPRDVFLDALGDRRRRRRPPQLVDQPLRRDYLVGVQQQHRQQRPLLAPAQRQPAIVLDHLQRAEKPEIHRVEPTVPRCWRIDPRLPLVSVRVYRRHAQCRARDRTRRSRPRGAS
jgi:hypothetical protein